MSRLLKENAFGSVNTILSETTRKTGLIQPSEPDINFWNNVGFYFLQNGMFQQAADLYQALYQTQLREQRESERLHKGVALHNWGISIQNLQRRPEAQELIMLAYIEDCITSGKNAVEKLGYKTLRNEFNVPEEILDAIYSCATSTHAFDKYPPVDPNIVLGIFRKDEEFWIRQARNNALFNLNFDYYKDLLQKTKSAGTNDEKKKTLETLSEVLFSSIKGFTVLPPVRTSKAEIDRRIRNYSDHLLLRDLGLYVLIECKNWSEPVGAPVLRDFKAKVEDHRCTSGILLSKKGITGEGIKDAQGEIRDAYKVKGITIIVLTEGDLEVIANGENPISILERKYEEVKFM
jgi:hypothetical protein